MSTLTSILPFFPFTGSPLMHYHHPAIEKWTKNSPTHTQKPTFVMFNLQVSLNNRAVFSKATDTET